MDYTNALLLHGGCLWFWLTQMTLPVECRHNRKVYIWSDFCSFDKWNHTLHNYGGNGIFLIELSGSIVYVTAKYKTELLVLECLSCVLSGVWSWHASAFHNHSVSCTVCYAETREAVTMIPTKLVANWHVLWLPLEDFLFYQSHLAPNLEPLTWLLWQPAMGNMEYSTIVIATRAGSFLRPLISAVHSKRADPCHVNVNCNTQWSM